MYAPRYLRQYGFGVHQLAYMSQHHKLSSLERQHYVYIGQGIAVRLGPNHKDV
jgi:hypothetical protein